MMAYRSAQVWFFDFIVAAILFFSVFSIAFKVMSTNSPQNFAMDTLSNDGNFLQYMLLSQGDPKNWTLSDVNLVGILNHDYSLNYTKLSNFYEVIKTDNDSYIASKTGIYSKFAVVFYSPNDSIVSFDFSGSGNRIYYFGYPGFNYTNVTHFAESVDNLVAKTNVIHNGTNLMQMKVFLWT